jgi:hypothetical protein
MPAGRSPELEYRPLPIQVADVKCWRISLLCELLPYANESVKYLIEGTDCEGHHRFWRVTKSSVSVRPHVCYRDAADARQPGFGHTVRLRWGFPCGNGLFGPGFMDDQLQPEGRSTATDSTPAILKAPCAHEASNTGHERPMRRNGDGRRYRPNCRIICGGLCGRKRTVRVPRGPVER